MNERIHKYFYEELSTEERLSLLRDVEASEELKKEFVEYQNLYALLNLGHQVQDKTIGKQKYDCFILQKQHSVMWKRWTRRIGYAAAILILVVSTSILTYWYAQPEQAETFIGECDEYSVHSCRTAGTTGLAGWDGSLAECEVEVDLSSPFYR